MTLQPDATADAARPVEIQINGEKVNAILYRNALSFSANVPESRLLKIRLPDEFPKGPVSILIVSR